jgi:hypothetical protein
MTVHQLPGRCWELQPPTDDERTPHYGTEAAAMESLREDRENDRQPYADTKPVQLDTPCWVVRCDGECEVALDTEDEGYIYHHDSRGGAERTAAAYHWAFSDDGRVFCEEDAPADAVALPSPAELEAAGQLVLPGVLAG